MRAQCSRLAKLTAAVGLVLAVGLTGLPAVADPNDDDPAVQEARRQEAIAAASVAELEGMLDDLRAETEAAQIRAAEAAEAYNAAATQLDAATLAAEQAETAAQAAETELASARATLSRVAVATSQQGTDLGVLEPFLTADGLEDAMARGAMLHVVGSSTQRATSQLALAKQSAEQARVKADDAMALQGALAAEAETKAQAAAEAATAAEAAEAAAEVEHQQLLEELAAKRQTTVEAEAAAEQRRIDEANRKAEEERRRREQEALQPPTPVTQPTPTPTPTPSAEPSQTATASPAPSDTASASPAPSDTASPTATPSDGADSGTAGTDSGGTDTSGEDNASGETATPTPPAGGGSISSDAAAQAAVDWARAQIGKPYHWGGNGPDSFDCSGLTSQAYYNTSGKWIMRTAADQYAAATKISYDDMRPGDLIFWDNGNGVYHVAIYSGGGMMIEAPRTGLNVRETPIRWANTTLWAGRV